MLIGRNNALIKSYGHNKSEWFGVGDQSDRYWGAVVRQALILGFIDKNIEITDCCQSPRRDLHIWNSLIPFC